MKDIAQSIYLSLEQIMTFSTIAHDLSVSSARNHVQRFGVGGTQTDNRVIADLLAAYDTMCDERDKAKQLAHYWKNSHANDVLAAETKAYKALVERNEMQDALRSFGIVRSEDGSEWCVTLEPSVEEPAGTLIEAIFKTIFKTVKAFNNPTP